MSTATPFIRPRGTGHGRSRVASSSSRLRFWTTTLCIACTTVVVLYISVSWSKKRSHAESIESRVSPKVNEFEQKPHHSLVNTTQTTTIDTNIASIAIATTATNVMKDVASLPGQQALSSNRSLSDYAVRKLPWTKFIDRDHQPPGIVDHINLPADVQLVQCSAEVQQKLAAPGLSRADFEWCQWALSANGGNVIVGKSYGRLDGKSRERYEQLNCNSVARGSNPSCDDAWGDSMIKNWKQHATAGESCGAENEFTSRVQCSESASNARFCLFQNVLMDFSKMHNVDRRGRTTGSRKWDPGFLASHCDSKNSNINYFDFYKPAVDPKSTTCDYVFNETVLAYSHDDIRNLGHTMSDIMNVWAMLWMSGTGDFAKDMTFLNIDALRMGHNYHDQLFAFGRHYELQFGRIFTATSLGESKGTVCFKRLIMQPKPVILFTWDGWWQDMKCTFLGPSSLFQRWNIQYRRNFGLLRSDIETNSRIQVLLLLRKASAHTLQQSSRVMRNTDEVQRALAAIDGITLVVQDLSLLSFEAQVKLIASSSILVGVHGAGIASSMHMSVGTKYCCGVIEIFPQGEFAPIRGYGNMARRMGHHYERVMLTSEQSSGNGAHVPGDLIQLKTRSMIDKIKSESSCVMPSVLLDPNLNSVPSAWDT